MVGRRCSGLRAAGGSPEAGLVSDTHDAGQRAWGAAGAYETAEDHAGYYIGFWRNRPNGLPPAIEEIFARLVNAFLIGIGTSYNQQLAGIKGFLTGGEVDLDQLDAETRKWVEEGLAKNEEWLENNNSGLGPLIPNTAATGDDRGWIPQGLGYDPATGTLLQGYYTKDGEDKGDAAYLALIDELTGKEKGEVTLGGTYYDDDGRLLDGGIPTHAGGVSVDGNNVYVVDNGEVYTYSLSDMRGRCPGETIDQSAPPQKGMSGGSYSAIKDGKLYLGDHDKNELYVYTREGDQWVKEDTIETPDNCQGVLVRDNEFVFSASSGRHEDNSQLYVQGFDGDTEGPYDLPSMSQGVVEVNGELVATYESGAEEFDTALPLHGGWWWGQNDHSDLWANPHMTRTPLSEMGLAEDLQVVPETLLSSASEFSGPAAKIKSLAGEVDAFYAPSHIFGEVPKAADLSASINKLLEATADSLRTGASAVDAVSQLLQTSAKDYTGTDERVDAGFRRMTPR